MCVYVCTRARAYYVHHVREEVSLWRSEESIRAPGTELQTAVNNHMEARN